MTQLSAVFAGFIGSLLILEAVSQPGREGQIGLTPQLPAIDTEAFNSTFDTAFEALRKKFPESVKNDDDTKNRMRIRFKKIAEHNANESRKTTQGLTAISALTESEYKRLNGFQIKTGNLQNQKTADAGTFQSSSPPDTVDWSDGYSPSVKNQGQCGSCWAFAAVATIEIAGAIASEGKTVVSLSEEELVQCDNGYTDYGCEGGNYDIAYDGIIGNNGVCSGHSYEYTGQDAPCKISENEKHCSKLVDMNKYYRLERLDEATLKRAVVRGAVAVAIQADQDIFMDYKSGIIDEPDCGTTVDHAVTVVGYGSENGVNYWKVRNSWGSGWGENGYFRIVRDKNMCGIAEWMTTPYEISFAREPTSDELAYDASGAMLKIAAFPTTIACLSVVYSMI